MSIYISFGKVEEIKDHKNVFIWRLLLINMEL
jgi:hypothetical protein